MLSFRLFIIASAGVLVMQPTFAQKAGTFSKADADAVLNDEGTSCDAKSNGDTPGLGCSRAFSLTSPGATNATSTPSTVKTNGKKASGGKATKVVAVSSTTSSPKFYTAHELPIEFQLGSYQLTDQSKKNAAVLASAMMTPANRSKKIMVSGHTDHTGSATLNYDLSRKRAEAVASYMQSLGVTADRLETKGFGFDQLLPGVSAASPRNRRVEVRRID